MSKIQQAYWEFKRFSFSGEDDDCVVSNDHQLDSKIQLLQYSDVCLDNLIIVLHRFSKTLKDLKKSEKKFGTILEDLGEKDTTRAGTAMAVCGNTYSKISRRRKHLHDTVNGMLRDVQSFHQNATADAFETVSSMERARNSYRSGLMWLKEESNQLSKEENQPTKKFKQVQDHIRKLQNRFCKSKLKTLQKIDLYLFSRCNLFSRSISPFQREFRKMCSFITANTDMALKAINSQCTHSYANKYSNEVYHRSMQTSLQLKTPDKALKRNLSVKKHIKKLKHIKIDKMAKSSKDLLINFDDQSFQNIKPHIPNCNLNKESYLENLKSLEIRPDHEVTPSKKEEEKQLDIFNSSGDKELALISISPGDKELALISLTKPENLEDWSLMDDSDLENNLPEALDVGVTLSCASKLDELLDEFDPLRNEKSPDRKKEPVNIE